MAMQMLQIPFGTTDWSTVEATTHAGEQGTATWRTRQFNNIRVRMVACSAGCVSDHWGAPLSLRDAETAELLALGARLVATG